ncbi:MAG: ankyrin repeat domain-containing protein [Verrucomicrobiota bacterium]|nr:ankyrin repeat domain-containing protein [Verrucomicrobiota bacterium]
MRRASPFHLVALGLAAGCGGEIRKPPTDGASSPGEAVAATNLFHAAQLGDLAAMQQYLGQGQSVTNRHAENGQTALHYAAWGGQTNTIAWLLNQKANVNALDDDGKSPLDYAWMPRGEAARKILTAAGAKPGGELRPPEPPKEPQENEAATP